MKKHYPWWGYIKAVIREYPFQIDADLSGVALRNHNAVKSAIEKTERMPDGENRMKVIERLHFSDPRILTLDGVAQTIPCDRATAARWQRRFFEEVARNKDLID